MAASAVPADAMITIISWLNVSGVLGRSSTGVTVGTLFVADDIDADVDSDRVADDDDVDADAADISDASGSDIDADVDTDIDADPEADVVCDGITVEGVGRDIALQDFVSVSNENPFLQEHI